MEVGGETDRMVGVAYEKVAADGSLTWSATSTVNRRLAPMPGPSTTRISEWLTSVAVVAAYSRPVAPYRTACTSGVMPKFSPTSRTRVPPRVDAMMAPSSSCRSVTVGGKYAVVGDADFWPSTTMSHTSLAPPPGR